MQWLTRTVENDITCNVELVSDIGALRKGQDFGETYFKFLCSLDGKLYVVRTSSTKRAKKFAEDIAHHLEMGEE